MSATAEHTTAQSSTRVDPSLHVVTVPSPLQVDVAVVVVHGGKQDAHHDGDVAEVASAQLMLASMLWHEVETTSRRAR